MKICIPTETNLGAESAVYVHFGSAPFFAIFNSDDQSLKTIDNSGRIHVHGQCHPAKELIDLKIDAVISAGMGQRAVRNLNNTGIRVYLTDTGSTVQQIIEKFSRNELTELSAEHACQGHGCH